MEVDKIKRKILFTLVVLFLGLTLSLSMGTATAADNSSTVQDTLFNSSSSQNTSTVTSNQFTSNSNTTSQSEGTDTTTIKVLIYNGEASIGLCVTAIEDGLDSANANNLAPGYRFTYATSTVINTSTLTGYDVLAMPGGRDGYFYVSSSSISGTAIKNFVSNGGGYLGICAGAYSGAKAVKGWYDSWGIAPHVICTRPWVEGDVPLQIEAAGEQIFGYGGIITAAHYNGPAMYAIGAGMVTFATYADDSCNSQGLGAIVGDYYGEGRVVLSGPHPELDPKHLDILAKLFVWAANKSEPDTTPTPTPTPTDSVTIDQLSSAATSVKSSYETNKTLPTNVNINGNQISMPQFLYLLASGTVELNSGITTPITIKSVNPASAPAGTYKSGSIKKSEYVQLAKDIISFINSNGRVPNYKPTTLGKISFPKLVYMYSKIMNYYKTYGRLPNYVSI